MFPDSLPLLEYKLCETQCILFTDVSPDPCT